MKHVRDSSPAPSQRTLELHTLSTAGPSSLDTSEPSSSAAEGDDTPREAAADQEVTDGRRAQVAASTWADKKLAPAMPYQPSR